MLQVRPDGSTHSPGPSATQPSSLKVTTAADIGPVTARQVKPAAVSLEQVRRHATSTLFGGPAEYLNTSNHCMA